jgi:hypothetical protein
VNLRHVHGLKESIADLKRLGKNLEMRGLAVAVRAGVEVLLPEVLAKAPVDEGAYKDALEVRPPRRRRGTVLAGIGLNRARLYTSTQGQRPYNLPALLEYGHVIRGDDRLLGTVAAKPHFRPALEAHADDALERVRVVLHDFVMGQAERRAGNENNLRKSLAHAEKRVAFNRGRAKSAAARGDREKVAKYLARVHAAETKRLRYSRKLGW